MKYTVFGLQQDKLLEWGLDLKDAAILRYIIDFQGTHKMKSRVIQGEEYFWVFYSAIRENLPILGIEKEDTFYRRFKKYVKVGLMKHRTTRAGGVFSWYRFDPDMRAELLGADSSETKPDENPGQTGSKSGINRMKSRNKDSSISDYSSKFKEDSHTSPGKLQSDKRLSAVAIATSHKPSSLVHSEMQAYQRAGGPFASYGKEGASMRRLVAYAERAFPDDPPAFLEALRMKFGELRAGRVPGMNARERAFWASQPFTPSALLSVAERVAEYLKKHKTEEVDQEVMEAMRKAFAV